MKRLGYPLALIFVSLAFVIFFTTVTAVTLASYSKGVKSSTKELISTEVSTLSR